MSQTASRDQFRAQALNLLHADERIEAVLEAGAGAVNRADRYSDLDFVLIARDAHYDGLLVDRRDLAERLGTLLTSFTGEHVGEPRLLICLYAVPDGDGLLHVDLKIIRRSDIAYRVDEPLILFDKENACGTLMAQSPANWPERPPQWFEDRVWVWLHYAAARAGRGECYEALDMVGCLRAWVIGPMLAASAGRPQRGLRYVETIPHSTKLLAATIAAPNLASLGAALLATLNLYLQLRQSNPPPVPHADAEAAVRRYIDVVMFN